jgi:hypothetical protein
MLTPPNDNYPRLCSEVGLTCECCTSETARQLARVCKGLRGKMISQLFVQIYPQSACAKMHGHFTASYHLNSTPAAEVDGPIAIAAVA